MHMVLYNATSGDKDFREKATAFIHDLKEKGDSMIYEEIWKDEQRFIARRGLIALAKLYEKGYDNLFLQYEQGINHKPEASASDGLVLQILPTYRWKKKYDTSEAYDVVMAVPSWNKVVAFSTTDMISDSDPLSIKRYERLHIEKFHFYPFFNRAHGVRGRKVVQESKSHSMHFLQDFSFLLRTCEDAVMIGRSCRLSAFTPVETLRGLQLGFYFMVICKIKKVEAVRTIDNFGSTLRMTKLTLSDGQVEFQAELNTQIFLENISLPFNKIVEKSILDPLQLSEYSGWTAILCVWLLGNEIPSVAAIQFLGERGDVNELLFKAFLKTRRKIALETDIKQWKNIEKDLTFPSRNTVVDKKWVYYKENDWNAQVFLAAICNQFKNLPFNHIIKTNVSYADCRKWEHFFQSLIRVNPEILKLYLSENPQSILQEMYNADPKGEQPQNDQMSTSYKCTNCNIIFKEFQFLPTGKKRCPKCNSSIETLLHKENRIIRKDKEAPRNTKMSRFLGSDPWLKSLFD